MFTLMRKFYLKNDFVVLLRIIPPTMNIQQINRDMQYY